MWWIGVVVTILVGLGLFQGFRRRKAMQKALVARCLGCNRVLGSELYCAICDLSDRAIRESSDSALLIDLGLAIDALAALNDHLNGFDVSMLGGQDQSTVASELRSFEQQAIDALRDHPELVHLLPTLDLGGFRHTGILKWTSRQPKLISESIRKLEGKRTEIVEQLRLV